MGMYGRKDDKLPVLTKTTPLDFLPNSRYLRIMRNPRYLVIATMLCLIFWITAWSCHGAPGGTPSPPPGGAGQTEKPEPRGSDLLPTKKTALCLIQDLDQAKLIPGISAFSTLQPWFGNACSLGEWGNCSPRKRSLDRTASMSCEAKEYLSTQNTTNSSATLLQEANWLVGLRRIRTFTT
jgi:hypothetical protein